MRDKLYNALWGIGARLANAAQRAGVLGSSRSLLRKLGHILIPAPRVETAITLPSGMRMVAPAGMRGARSYAAGVYEEDLTALFGDLLRKGMTVVDLGALLGYYTLLASSLVGATGRVYAFEPEPRGHAYLLRNVEMNDCRNVVAVKKAASARTGTATFVLSSTTGIGPAGGVLSTDPSSSDSVVVETTSLDDFFQQRGWPSIDLIKMDIDGAEGRALEGMRELSRRNAHMRLIMEFDPERVHQAGGTREALAARLQSLGFRNGHLIERKLKPFSLVEGFPVTGVPYNVLLKKR